MSAAGEYVGLIPPPRPTFQQTGGTNTHLNLSIGSGGQYGRPEARSGRRHPGQQRAPSRAAARLTLAANCILDLTAGAWENLSGLSSTWAAVTAGGSGRIQPVDRLRRFHAAGLTYTPGTALKSRPRNGFAGCGTFADQVDCQGSIAATSAAAVNLA